MATFLIKPRGAMDDLVMRGLAKIFRDNKEGGREEIADYLNPMLPGGSRGFRIHFDPDKRFYPIVIDKEELNSIVSQLRYTDPLTGKLIETADPRNERDPFFCLTELEINVPNTGLLMSDSDPLGKFWLAAAKAEPKIFNIDNNTDNPAVKRVQEFNIITAGYTDKELKEQLSEGKRALAIFFAHRGDYQWMQNICRGMDIVVAEDAKIDALEDVILLKITVEKDFKTKGGVRFIEQFLLLSDMKQDVFETKSRIKKAIHLGIIVKEGRRYSFDEQLLGTTPDGVADFLMKDENTDIRGYILAQLEEKSSVK